MCFLSVVVLACNQHCLISVITLIVPELSINAIVVLMIFAGIEGADSVPLLQPV